MYERFQELLKMNNVTVAELCRATGLNESSLSNWKKRNKGISTDTLKSICEYLEASSDWLLGISGNKPNPNLNLMTGEEPQSAGETFYSRDEQELIGDYRSLNDIGKASVRAYMTGIMQNPEMCRQKREESLQG